MSHRPRLVLLLVAALTAPVVAACGGGGEKVSSATDVNELLRQTFAKGSPKAGATSTGEKGFLSLNGQEYAVSEEVFRQFKAGYEQAVKQAARRQGKQQSLAALGIDPRRWLKNPRNEGDAKVGDDDTVKVSADIDV